MNLCHPYCLMRRSIIHHLRKMPQSLEPLGSCSNSMQKLYLVSLSSCSLNILTNSFKTRAFFSKTFTPIKSLPYSFSIKTWMKWRWLRKHWGRGFNMLSSFWWEGTIIPFSIKNLKMLALGYILICYLRRGRPSFSSPELRRRKGAREEKEVRWSDLKEENEGEQFKFKFSHLNFKFKF